MCAHDDDLYRAVHSLLLAHQQRDWLRRCADHVGQFGARGRRRLRSVSDRRRCSAGAAWARSIKARDTTLNRDVALKILPFTVSLDSDRVARFQREAEVLASLNHPNIAILHGLEEPSPAPVPRDGAHRRGDAVRTPREGTLPMEEALRIARRSRKHSKSPTSGIVHRDLKPGNVMLGPRRHREGARLRPGQDGRTRAAARGPRNRRQSPVER